MSALVLRADARALPLPDASVDLIVTSPPYFALRSYQDGGQHYAGQIGSEKNPSTYVDALLECTREWMRVLKRAGSIWVNLGDKYNAYNGNRGNGTIQKNEPRQAVPRGRGLVPTAPNKTLLGLPWRYAIRCLDELGLVLRAEVIWSKPNGLPESVTDRVRRSHEQWFHFTQAPRYFSAVDEIREAHIHGGQGATWAARKAAGEAMRHGDTGGGASLGSPIRKAGHALGKLPGSVWEIATEPLKVPEHLGVDHFAAFPMEWPRRIIQGWSQVGGLVVDPFGGTGTTALVASALDRIGVSVDMSADYCRIARWRTTDPAQRAKALGVEKPTVPLPGQADLFADWAFDADSA